MSVSAKEYAIDSIQFLREYAFNGHQGCYYSSHSLNVMEPGGVPETKAYQHIYSLTLQYGDQIVSTVITVTESGDK